MMALVCTCMQLVKSQNIIFVFGFTHDQAKTKIMFFEVLFLLFGTTKTPLLQTCSKSDDRAFLKLQSPTLHYLGSGVRVAAWLQAPSLQVAPAAPSISLQKPNLELGLTRSAKKSNTAQRNREPHRGCSKSLHPNT